MKEKIILEKKNAVYVLCRKGREEGGGGSKGSRSEVVWIETMSISVVGQKERERETINDSASNKNSN